MGATISSSDSKRYHADIAVLENAAHSLLATTTSKLNAARDSGNQAKQDQAQDTIQQLTLILQACLDMEITQIDDSDLMQKTIAGLEGINDRITTTIAKNRSSAKVLTDIGALATSVVSLRKAIG